MKVTKAEIVRGKEPILLPQPWLAAWCEPDGKPVTSFEFVCYRLYTDEGIVGIGPYTGGDPALVEGVDPFMVRAFWDRTMSGRRAGNSGHNAAGLDTVAHEWMQTFRRGVPNPTQPDSSDAFACFLFGGKGNQRLAFGLATTHTFFRTTPQVRLVNLDSPAEPFTARPDHGAPELVQPRPSGPVTAQAQHALQAQGAGARLLAGHPPDGPEPKNKRLATPLKDRTGLDGSLVPAR